MSKIKYVTAKDSADLNRIQDIALKLINRGRDALQIALVATIIHAAKHGDYTGANRLVHSLANSGTNGPAVVEWFAKFGGLKIGKATSEDGKDIKEFTSWSGAEYIKANLEDAKAKMWWTLKKKSAFDGWDANKVINQFLAKRKQMIEAANNPELSDEDKAKIVTSLDANVVEALLSALDIDSMLMAAEQEQPVEAQPKAA